jgi:hypothetical protein
VGDPEYVAGADLRTGALVDSRLVCMQVGVST